MPPDLQWVLACRGEVKHCGMALLLKALTYLGYVPDRLQGIPDEVRTFVAGQLGLMWDYWGLSSSGTENWDRSLLVAACNGRTLGSQ
jgi:hypothetical protein